MNTAIKLDEKQQDKEVKIDIAGPLRLNPASRTFLERSIAAMVKVSGEMSEQEALDLLKKGTDADMLGGLLMSELVRELLNPSTSDPLLEAKLRGARFRQEILSRPDMLTAQEAAEVLGMTRQGVDAKRKNNQLLALEGGSRGYKYPAWQFDEGRVVDGLPDVLRILYRFSTWLKYRFLISPDPYLHDQKPIDVLKRGDVERVKEATMRYASGEQGGN